LRWCTAGLGKQSVCYFCLKQRDLTTEIIRPLEKIAALFLPGVCRKVGNKHPEFIESMQGFCKNNQVHCITQDTMGNHRIWVPGTYQRTQPRPLGQRLQDSISTEFGLGNGQSCTGFPAIFGTERAPRGGSLIQRSKPISRGRDIPLASDEGWQITCHWQTEP
jgi:hypothetical protein